MLGRFPLLPSIKPTSERICERGGRPWRAGCGARERALGGDSLEGPGHPSLSPRLRWTHFPTPEMAEIVQKGSPLVSQVQRWQRLSRSIGSQQGAGFWARLAPPV